MTKRKALMLFGVAAVAAGAIRAQTVTPTPHDDVVRISTSLVQFDVTITGQEGRAITDIRPDEIEVYSNGKKQNLTNFSFVSVTRQGAQTPPTKNSDRTVISLPPAPVTPSDVRRTMAVIVDDLSLSWESVYYAKRALYEFVDKEVQPGDLVAILRTGTGVGTLQQFTNDKRLLRAAIDKIKYNPLGLGEISALKKIEPNPAQVMAQGGALPGGAVAAQMTATMIPPKEVTAIQGGGIGAVRYIVSGMKDLPGRKSALYFSDGFNLFDPGPNEMATNSLTMIAVHLLIEEANRAGVIFYPVDPRGLQVTNVLMASDNTTAMSRSSIRGEVDKRRVKFRVSQEGAIYLADQTGGFAILNSNNIGEKLRQALDDQSYYLIAYAPDSDTFNAATKYNKLEIKVLRKNATVRYRHGFFGYVDRTKNTPAANSTQDYIDQLRDAALSPFGANGIAVRLTSLFGSGPEGTPYVRSLLHIDAGDLKFTDENDGQKTCAFDVLATSFGDNGQVVDQIGKRYSMTVTPQVYEKVLNDGLVYHFQFPVTKPGAYQYRVAIRDANNGRIGAASQFLQVPDAKKGELTLSSIALENMSVEQFQAKDLAGATDAMTDTAIRRIKVGRVYRYSLEIYNATLDSQRHPNLQTRIRVFRDGQLLLDGTPKAFDAAGQSDPTRLRFFSGIAIGSQMQPGDYVLQVIVTDANRKGTVATQFVSFEVVE